MDLKKTKKLAERRRLKEEKITKKRKRQLKQIAVRKERKQTVS